MEMAEYILSIFKHYTTIIWSWGFHRATAIDNGLSFAVNGFKFKGIVRVVYNEGTDLFDLEFCHREKVVKSMNGIYLDNLVDVIDNEVEKVENYKQKVNETYFI